ncbi:MAG TPA: phospholipase D-like domain-containing protein, partial [Candidatus Binataceae bacterium]|nr:phospholipase D-like domain-containing protein [Candidatus Binataceae bacterium]
PNAGPLIHMEALHLEHPRFVGPYGSLTRAQGQRIIARIQSHQETPTDILQRHIGFETAISDVPLVVGNKVTLLENASATYPAMLKAIHGAQDNINLEMYILSNGKIGQMFANALIERARHGVKVNLIYDAVGSLNTPASFFDNLRSNGIAIVEFNPLSPFQAKHWSFAKLTHRDHRKMLIVDGRTAFTGGINISEVYASGIRPAGGNTPPAYWRDTDIEVDGPAAAEFQKLFMKDWYREGGITLNPQRYFPRVPAQGRQIVRVIGSVPEQFSGIYVDLISAVVNSETNVYITDAYFAPDYQMRRALRRAARRGVDVRLLLPSQSDEPFIVSAQRAHYHGLLEAGVKIYEWSGKMLHAKTATIDGVWSTVGTSNLDWWSIARDNEVNAVVLGHKFGDEMNLMFKNDLEDSKQIELAAWDDRSLLERLRERFAEFISPLL